MAQKPLNLAHRGFSSKYPENTMIAFKKALEEGHCEGIYLNVHITADHQVVVIHDDTLERTTTGQGFVKDHTYDGLLAYDAGIKFDSQFEGEKIPLLADVLTFAKEHDLFLNIELKNCDIYYDDLERVTIRLIHEAKYAQRVALSSFNHQSMEKCKSIDSDIIIGYMCGCPMLRMDEYLDKGRARNFLPHYRVLYYDRVLAQTLKDSHQYQNYVWVVNDEKNMQKMIDLGADGIITDCPDRLHLILEEISEMEELF